GGVRGGPRGPYEQSGRAEHYEAALRRLADDGRLFPCHRTRRELRDIASAPHGPGGSAYPAHLRPADLKPDWFSVFVDAEPGSRAAALRFRVEPGVVTFQDGLFGAVSQDVAEEVGDFVLKRRDGLYAYQLAVIVDDLAMGVSEVVRGVDLLDSTARQIQLIEALGGVAPAWIHVPLIVDADGEKLSKRHESLTLLSLRAAGVGPEQLTGYLAHSAGLLDRVRPCRPRDLVESFDWTRVSRRSWTLPDDIVQRLLAIS
ncbi:MAG: glutamate--tRNA ligase family protein, partial [Acidobacteriota bacterium]